MKRCSKCNVDKPLDVFSKCAANKDGLQRWCKECSKAAKKEWYEKNAEAEKTKAMAKANASSVEGMPIPKQYNDGYKWVELKHDTDPKKQLQRLNQKAR